MGSIGKSERSFWEEMSVFITGSTALLAMRLIKPIKPTTPAGTLPALPVEVFRTVMLGTAIGAAVAFPINLFELTLFDKWNARSVAIPKPEDNKPRIIID